MMWVAHLSLLNLMQTHGLDALLELQHLLLQSMTLCCQCSWRLPFLSSFAASS